MTPEAEYPSSGSMESFYREHESPQQPCLQSGLYMLTYFMLVLDRSDLYLELFNSNKQVPLNHCRSRREHKTTK